MDFGQGKIVPVNLEHEMKNSYIDYAMSVIVARALPDVRDGLKPVHRRILYAMQEAGMGSNKPYKKSARIVGEVLGKYHPHGDLSVYDAIVRMAQDFSMRYMLADGHGNFGSVDGDPAAAMRYTEVRMSKIAELMLQDIDKETVDFAPNYDESLKEPTVLPAKFPQLLVNGTSGIAVGMATNIPPHNMCEVIDGTLMLIDHPEATIDDLMKVIKGPDFPTAGLVLGQDGIRQAYTTGRGVIKMRANARIETLSNGKPRIIVTELPYQVNKARLVEKIAQLVRDKQIEGITALNDESDRGGMRIVIDLRRDANANVILNQLYKHTQLQDSFGVIMLALVDGKPKILNLKEVLHYYIAHQEDVITRRTRMTIDTSEIDVEDLIAEEDVVITLTHNNYIKRMALDTYRRQNRGGKGVKGMPTKEKDFVENLLITTTHHTILFFTNRCRVYHLKAYEIAEASRTAKGTAIINLLQLEKDEKITAVIQVKGFNPDAYLFMATKKGIVKKTSLIEFKNLHKGGLNAINLDDDDELIGVKFTDGERDMILGTKWGMAIVFSEDDVRSMGRAARGVKGISLNDGDEVIGMDTLSPNAEVLTVTAEGYGKRTETSEYRAQNRGGKGLINLKVTEKTGDVIGLRVVHPDQELMLITTEGIVIRTNISDISVISRNTQGVKLMSTSENDIVASMAVMDQKN